MWPSPIPCFAFFHPFQLVTLSVSSTTFDIPVPKSHTHTTATPPERYSSFDRYIYFCVVAKEERDCRKNLCVCSLSVAGPLWPRTTPHHASLFTNFSQTSSPIPSTKPRTAKPKSDSQCRTKAITPSNLSTRLRGVFFSSWLRRVFVSYVGFFFQEGIERADTCF